MSKTRLNEDMRHRLHVIISGLAGPAAQMKAERKAYARAAPLVIAMVEKRFPVADMAVCRRYKVATQQNDVQISLDVGGIKHFNFDPNTGPIEPGRGYKTITHMANKKTSRAVSAWVMTVDALNDVRKKRARDYQALVKSSRTVEEVMAVWPEAKAVLPSNVGKELVALSPEVIDRIQADVNARRRAA